ncbi:hypothetical protein CPC08DRAFT_712844 [Agrocybe pediades]|nr:hypothetical protein CPC08DRAFT_712844 [Agrocybe pediades]
MALIAGADEGTASSREELQRAWTFLLSSGAPFIDNARPIADDGELEGPAGHWSGNPHLPFNVWSNGTRH